MAIGNGAFKGCASWARNHCLVPLESADLWEASLSLILWRTLGTVSLKVAVVWKHHYPRDGHWGQFLGLVFEKPSVSRIPHPWVWEGRWGPCISAIMWRCLFRMQRVGKHHYPCVCNDHHRLRDSDACQTTAPWKGTRNITPCEDLRDPQSSLSKANCHSTVFETMPTRVTVRQWRPPILRGKNTVETSVETSVDMSDPRCMECILHGPLLRHVRATGAQFVFCMWMFQPSTEVIQEVAALKVIDVGSDGTWSTKCAWGPLHGNRVPKRSALFFSMPYSPSSANPNWLPMRALWPVIYELGNSSLDHPFSFVYSIL